MSRTAARRAHRITRLPLAAAICFALSAAAMAQDAPSPAPDPQAQPDTAKKERTATLATVQVSAQKREENLQDVPISIQVLDTQALKEHNVGDFKDYAALLPSVSFDQAAPGFVQIYMRGVVDGGNGNHSGPQPSVGVYLDEQPITTITGPLDLHVYDINRVEALSGPQGTLYGASSQSGTLKIITNKPNPDRFESGYALEANTVSGGGTGWTAEGYLNAPLGKSAAVRVVAWDVKDAGYMDIKGGERTFSNGIALDNRDECTSSATRVCSHLEGDNVNSVDTRGARAALKFDIGENWSITPGLMTQTTDVNGTFFADRTAAGDYGRVQFSPDNSRDKFTQGALTIQGKIGNFDVTYAYANLHRDIDGNSDYSDYAFFYDAYYQNYYASQGLPNYFAELFVDDNGNPISMLQHIESRDRFRNTTHELRVASPVENRFRFVAGLFWQQQNHNIQQVYKIDNLTADLEVPGWEDTLWLTKQLRKDHNEALFGELTYDFTDKLTVTAGMRWFKVDNSLRGFFGFGEGYSSSTGVARCRPEFGSFETAPCVNLQQEVTEKDHLGKVNVTYNFTPSKMIYGTWSEGYRPGGVNRRDVLNDGTVIRPYVSDFLTSWEFGWKTTWMDNHLAWNGAIFNQTWEDFQFSFLPPAGNGLTLIYNAPAARIRGLETDVTWAVNYNLKINAAVAFYDGKLTKNYCDSLVDGVPVDDCADPAAPAGTRLPITPRSKGNITARYTFDLGSYEAYWQGTALYESSRTTALTAFDASVLGDLPSYGRVDFSAGIRRDNWALDFYVKNLFNKYIETGRAVGCDEAICGSGDLDPAYPHGQVYTVPGQPRTIGLRWSQDF